MYKVGQKFKILRPVDGFNHKKGDIIKALYIRKNGPILKIFFNECDYYFLNDKCPEDNEIEPISSQKLKRKVCQK